MRILVTGGRTFWDVDAVIRVLGQFDGSDHHLFHGGATGADSLCKLYAVARGWNVTGLEADFAQEGPTAGTQRNSELLARARPDVLVVFPGANGTHDMIRKAVAAGIRVITNASDRFAT